MRIPIAIAVVTAAAISPATPVQADACSDYRLAVAGHEAAQYLINDRAAAGFTEGKSERETLLNLLHETDDRRDEARRAVRGLAK